MAIDLSSKCPYGIVNLNAVAEVKAILGSSPKHFHKQLYDWLNDNYSQIDSTCLISTNAEPIGCRIKSVQDLSMLVCAYSHARAFKEKATRKRNLDHELYFYGQLPNRDAAEEAGRLMRIESISHRVGGNGSVVLGRLC
jgi:hypothetical protein